MLYNREKSIYNILMFTRLYYFLFLGIMALFSINSFAAENGDNYDRQRLAMVESQIEARGVSDAEVLEAMRKVERHLFVPENRRHLAYKDFPLPIGYRQTISQPYIVAYMTEAVRLKQGDRVLEIGTGSGYQAAVLATIAKEVYTIEIVSELADESAAKLKKLGYDNIKVKWGDGYHGWPEYAPFDVIIVTAAPPTVPEKLVEQLNIGGRMIVPVGKFFQQLELIEKTRAGIQKKDLLPVRFVPMVKRK